MRMKKSFKVLKQIKMRNGFTLIEALLAVALLALLTTVISAPFISGLWSLDVQAEHMLLDSHLRGQMEALVSQDFSMLCSGSDNATIGDQNYTISWTVVNVDLNGDLIPESNAVQVTVSIDELPERSMTTLVVNNEGRLGKI